MHLSKSEKKIFTPKEQQKLKRQSPISLNAFLSILILFIGLVGLCYYLKIQEVTLTVPTPVVVFCVAGMGLSALYIIFKEVRSSK